MTSPLRQVEALVQKCVELKNRRVTSLMITESVYCNSPEMGLMLTSLEATSIFGLTSTKLP
jgi:hypothetical protein